jgi:NADH dehydrogenase/NADH:ubiquinone oxidoreductase subunit G
MTIWWLVLILAAIGSAGIAFIWLAVRIGSTGPAPKAKGPDSYEEAAEQDVEHIFNDDFREELRNRGRLHFEKIIGENAMFLQQDLRLTTSQLNEYMKGEITRKLKEEFAKYEQSIMDAKELAIESLQKTNDAIDEQRKVLGQEVQQELIAERKQLIEHFENNMADIVNHYVLAAVGDQIDLSDQLEYILADLEANKKAIIEDIQSGA